MGKELEILEDNESLASRYRPRKIEDLVGQEESATRLKAIFARKVKLPGSLIFVGPTGLGKTTLARMVAGYLNCDTFSACGKCANCKAIRTKSHPDVEEINFATERGIDELRAMIRRSRNKPRMGRLRIIIGDEAHNLTKQAGEGFLKPLEDPPPHTLWIIATSEPEKLPQTVLNRGMVFRLKRLTKDQVAGRVKYVAGKEGIKLKKKVIGAIAESSGGHMRDALSILESVHAAKMGGLKSVKSQIALALQGNSASEDRLLDEKAMVLIASMIGLSLTSFWRTAASVGAGEEVNLLNKMIFMLQYLIEDMAGNGRGPFVWHTPLNRKCKDTMKELVKDYDPKKYAFLSRMSTTLNVLNRLRNDAVTLSGNTRSMMFSGLATHLTAMKSQQSSD